MVLFNFQVAAAVQQEKLERSMSLNVERTLRSAEKMVDIKVPLSCLGQIKNIRGSSYPTDPKFGN